MNNGLTAERMMDSFPLALQKDPKMVALAHSIANVLEQRLDEINLGQIYTRIDELPEDLLDILAKDFAVDWYDKSYTLISTLPNTNRFAEKSSATRICGHIWTGLFMKYRQEI